MTKIDVAHGLGIKGKGMKIAIIDTGVDFRHPSLGGCFGPGCKIAFGYDFVTPKEDPGVTCIDGGHGTHVRIRPTLVSYYSDNHGIRFLESSVWYVVSVPPKTH